MSITRVNIFKAKEGGGAELRDHIAAFVPAIREVPGCLSCELLEGATDPTRIVVLEVWESVEAHQASVAEIPPGTVERAMELLDGQVDGAYYHRVEVV